MSMFSLESSNPALNNNDAFAQYYGDVAATARPATATMQGVVNKTAILVGITVAAGAGGYALFSAIPNWNMLLVSCIAAAITCFGVYFVIAGNPKRAMYVAPVYAVVEGVFLGGLTAALDLVLEKQLGVQTTLALPAFIITVSILMAMLGLYYTRILRPTKLFVSVVSTLTVGIMFMYLIGILLAVFGGPPLPYISLNSAMAGGTPAYIGLGLNAFILLIASLWLVIDFKRVEEIVNGNQPRYMEWYCGFALLVSLAWIYYEAVKLSFRLYLLFGRE